MGTTSACMKLEAPFHTDGYFSAQEELSLLQIIKYVAFFCGRGTPIPIEILKFKQQMDDVTLSP